jgi:hypothetical protein
MIVKRSRFIFSATFCKFAMGELFSTNVHSEN